MKQPSDQQLSLWAEKISRSDKASFDQLFRSLYPLLMRFAMRYTRDWAAAKDVTQDCFVKLWQRRDKIDPEKSLKSFLYTMVRNRALNMIRDLSNITVDDELVSDISEDVNMQDETEQGEETQLDGMMQEWISNLPERQKEAFELSRFEGLNHEEIAQVMDITPKTVNNHIVAALNHLRDHYDNYVKQNQR